MTALISEDQLKLIVLRTKLIDENGLTELSSFAKENEVSLADALIERDVINDENLGLLIADYLKIPFIVLSKTSIPENMFHIVPERIARRHKIIVFGRDNNGIKIAMSDPRNTEFLQMLAKKTGQKIYTYLATQRDIENTFKIYRKDLQKIFDEMLDGKAVSPNSTVIKEVPMAKIVDLIIEYSYQDKASDVHIEPTEKESLIRYRIDGILHDVVRLPKILHDQIVTRIKVLSRLRTDEHQSAQDGKMRIKFDEDNVDIRVSIIPIVEGEKVVLRILSTNTRQLTLLDLGMSEADLKKVEASYAKSFGMILSTGPTGSGKTTSIYAILKVLNKREKNITTIEDPVEYRIKGLNQIQVNPKTNLTFANGLRSILRQDPNVIFVGEIRDKETAGIGVNAALTGHLVLSTLHTNDAATALPRLIDMDIEPFLVASTINIIIAQRLVRKICEMCKTSIVVRPTEIMKNLPQEPIRRAFGDKKEVSIFQGQGCKICHNTGYEGRVGLFEVLVVSKQIKELITQKVDSDVIFRQAVQEGMATMLDDGLHKIAKGTTTIEEVLRVTKVESL